MLAWSKFLKYFIIVCCDLLAFYSSLLLAYLIRKNLFISEFQILPLEYNFIFFVQFWWFLVIFILVFFYEKLYTRKYPLWYEVKKILVSVSLVCILMMSILTLSKQAHIFPRSFILLFWFLASIIFPIYRYIFKKKLHKFDFFKERALFIGNDPIITSLIHIFDSEKYMGYEIIGYVHQTQIKNLNLSYLGQLEQLEEIMQDHDIEHVMITSDSSLQQNIHTQVLKKVKKLFIIPSFQEMPLYDSETYYLFMHQFFLIKTYNRAGYKSNKIIKLLFDKSLTLIICIFLLPLFIMIASFVKLTSKGAIIYKQKRVGYRNKIFYVVLI